MLSIPSYLQSDRQKQNFRKVNFKNAIVYEHDSYNLLQYLVLSLRIFNLEYIMGRNSTPASMIMNLE